jgi:hypothetical protein
MPAAGPARFAALLGQRPDAPAAALRDIHVDDSIPSAQYRCIHYGAD